MGLIKRDSKPCNPEKQIMIKLFEKMFKEKSSDRYFERVRMLLKERIIEIREASAKRGMYLDKEIKEASDSALKLITDAFTEIEKDEETQLNLKKPKLTAIQRNRMAVAFLEMYD